MSNREARREAADTRSSVPISIFSSGRRPDLAKEPDHVQQTLGDLRGMLPLPIQVFRAEHGGDQWHVAQVDEVRTKPWVRQTAATGVMPKKLRQEELPPGPGDATGVSHELGRQRTPRPARECCFHRLASPRPVRRRKSSAGRGWPSHGALPKQRRGHNRWTSVWTHTNRRARRVRRRELLHQGVKIARRNAPGESPA